MPVPSPAQPAPATSGGSAVVPSRDGSVPGWRRAARVAAVVYLGIVLLAVLWPSGGDIAEVKEAAGPWFLGAVGKDVVLNLGMLGPLTLLAALGWPGRPWWHWALAGTCLGIAAESAQWLLPVLQRRGYWLNAVENAGGAWAGAVLGLAVNRALLRRATGRRG